MSATTASFSNSCPWWHICDYDLRQCTCRWKPQRDDVISRETIHVLCTHSSEHEGNFYSRLFKSDEWLRCIHADIGRTTVFSKGWFFFLGKWSEDGIWEFSTIARKWTVQTIKLETNLNPSVMTFDHVHCYVSQWPIWSEFMHSICLAQLSDGLIFKSNSMSNSVHSAVIQSCSITGSVIFALSHMQLKQSD